jgi:hypothetical protein
LTNGADTDPHLDLHPDPQALDANPDSDDLHPDLHPDPQALDANPDPAK